MVYFKATFSTDILIDAPASVSFDVHGSQGHSLRVELREVTEADGLPDVPTLCSVSTIFEPGERVRGLLEGIADGTFNPEQERVAYVDTTTSSEGARKEIETGLRRERAPKPLEDFASQVGSEMFDAAERVLRTLRWRYGLKGSYRAPQGSLGTEFSLDGENWYPVPMQVRLSGLGGWAIPLAISDEVQTAIQATLDSGSNEPLGHVLLREAREQALLNPRSALIIGMAAAEVGFKECVADLVPDTAWLVEHVPSPDLVTMARDYLPLLPVRLRVDGKRLPPPAALLRSLKKGVTLRNQMAHRRAELPAPDVLKEVLQAVEDLLWLLDFYRGSAWAWDMVSGNARSELLTAK